MSGGGKGGRQTSATTIPAWVQEPAQANLARADEISQIGYVPYYGPDVAAFQPTQTAAFQNTADAASAFGMNGAMPNMPTPTEFAPGVQGYSSAPILDAAMEELRIRRPGQYAAINAQFIDPYATPQAQGAGKGGQEAAAAAAAQRDDGGHYNYDDMYGAQGMTLRNNNRGLGNIFGDGGFFDDTFLDLGLIDGDGRFGWAAPVTSAPLGRVFGGARQEEDKQSAVSAGNTPAQK